MLSGVVGWAVMLSGCRVVGLSIELSGCRAKDLTALNSREHQTNTNVVGLSGSGCRVAGSCRGCCRVWVVGLSCQGSTVIFAQSLAQSLNLWY